MSRIPPSLASEKKRLEARLVRAELRVCELTDAIRRNNNAIATFALKERIKDQIG